MKEASDADAGAANASKQGSTPSGPDSTPKSRNGASSLRSVPKASAAGAVPAGVGRLLLVVTAFLWATYGVTTRDIFQHPNAPPVSVFTFARKAFAAAFFVALIPFWPSPTPTGQLKDTPLCPQKKQEKDQESGQEGWQKEVDEERPVAGMPRTDPWQLGGASLVVPSLELGLWIFLGTALQAWGLENTTATRAGFVVQTTNVLVPTLAFLSGDAIPPSTWFAATLAMGGVVTMGFADSAPSANGQSFISDSALLGDLQVLPAAACYALGTIRIGRLVKVSDPFRLAFGSIVAAAFISGLWVAAEAFPILMNGNDAAELWPGWADIDIWVAIVISALFSGTLASLSQTYGQSAVPSTQAQVIYSLQPVFSAILAGLFLHEDLPPLGWGGAAVVLLASLVASESKAS